MRRGRWNTELTIVLHYLPGWRSKCEREGKEGETFRRMQRASKRSVSRLGNINSLNITLLISVSDRSA